MAVGLVWGDDALEMDSSGGTEYTKLHLTMYIFLGTVTTIKIKYELKFTQSYNLFFKSV